jgi:hypothetical protein
LSGELFFNISQRILGILSGYFVVLDKSWPAQSSDRNAIIISVLSIPDFLL